MKEVVKSGMIEMKSDNDGKTLIDPDELFALIPSITHRYELDELEQQNIRNGKQWARSSRNLKKDYPTDFGLRNLHKKMFENVWEWAGVYRKTEKNIGFVYSYQVPEEIKKLCDDIKYQLTLKENIGEEIAVRFHHRLTLIHPFPNGNGRFAREATDLLLRFNGLKIFTWGSKRKTAESTRTDYLSALRKADIGDFSALIKFVRE